MLTKIGLGLVACSVAVAAAGAAAVHRDGLMLVEVEDRSDDFHLRIPIPVVLAEVALEFVPDSELREARQELSRLRPVADAFFGSLEEADQDVTLVEVRDHRESVTVRIEDGNLVVEVEGTDERVFVRVPLRGVRSVATTLADW